MPFLAVGSLMRMTQFNLVPDNDAVTGGEPIDEKMLVEGKYTFEDGKIFEGGLIDGKMPSKGKGVGKLTYPDGITYMGEFIDGNVKGKGQLT